MSGEAATKAKVIDARIEMRHSPLEDATRYAAFHSFNAMDFERLRLKFLEE